MKTREDRKRLSRGAAALMALVAVVLVGCNQQGWPEPNYGPIEFGAASIVASQTRAVVDQEAIDGGGVNVYVHATKDNARLYPITQSVIGEQIVQNMSNAKWLPKTSGNVRQWVAESQYSFNGFAYLPTTATNSGGGLSIGSYGKEITVSQPSTYQPDKMIDYLYSHTFSTPGAARPLVVLDMEHALPLVEIHIVKHESIEAAYLENLTISNFFRSAKMNVTTPANYGSGGHNVWKIELSGERNTSYSITGTHPQTGEESGRKAMANRGEESESVMKMMVIPQQLEADAQLTVSYWVNERYSAESEDNYVRHEASFQLNKYTPFIWEVGHRIVYTLEVDTGIHLTGTIVPWVEVDYVEGTVLPNI